MHDVTCTYDDHDPLIICTTTYAQQRRYSTRQLNFNSIIGILSVNYNLSVKIFYFACKVLKSRQILKAYIMHTSRSVYFYKSYYSHMLKIIYMTNPHTYTHTCVCVCISIWQVGVYIYRCMVYISTVQLTKYIRSCEKSITSNRSCAVKTLNVHFRLKIGISISNCYTVNQKKIGKQEQKNINI